MRSRQSIAKTLASNQYLLGLTSLVPERVNREKKLKRLV